MQDLPAVGLANTITGFATLFSGIACLVLARAILPHPARWRFAYWTLVVTGVFTVTLHGFGETNPVFGPGWFWAFLDTGSNIVVAWAIALAALGDYYAPQTRRRGSGFPRPRGRCSCWSWASSCSGCCWPPRATIWYSNRSSPCTPCGTWWARSPSWRSGASTTCASARSWRPGRRGASLGARRLPFS